VIATTVCGASAAEGPAAQCDAPTEVLALGEERVEFAVLVQALAERYGARTIVCEGGPRLYGSMLGKGLELEEFLTLSAYELLPN